LAARLCEWAEHHRPAVWAEILTKYAGLSSKITLGEGMTSMGDIRPTHPIDPRRVWGSRMVRALELLGNPPSVRKARVFTSDVLVAEGVEASVIEVAVLLVSELVTNAIHGHGMICLTVDTDARSIRIEVEEGRAPPVRRPVPEGEVAARRLLVVDEFASAWGTERRATHKRVWFEIAR
jgi:hypothetical protein